MVMSRDQNARTAITNQNCRPKQGKALYHSVPNVLSSGFLSKNKSIIIFRTIILPVLLPGCETWSLNLREDYRLRVMEKRVMRRIFVSTMEIYQEAGEKCSITICKR
jgi:hypothetical protein